LLTTLSSRIEICQLKVSAMSSTKGTFLKKYAIMEGSMDYENLIKTMIEDLELARQEPCDCGMPIRAALDFDEPGNLRPFTYRVWRFCLECGYIEEL